MAMNTPKSLLNVMHEIESELQEFCSQDWIKNLASLIRKKWYGFSIKSLEDKHLWIGYEDAYIAFNDDGEWSIALSTSGSNGVSDSKRFKQDERVFSSLLSDLKKLKK